MHASRFVLPLALITAKIAAAVAARSSSLFAPPMRTMRQGIGAAVGFPATFRSFDLRLAAILGLSIFTLGAAMGHVNQMITAHNFAPGNAGIIFWTDILIPLFGFAFLWLSQPSANTRDV